MDDTQKDILIKINDIYDIKDIKTKYIYKFGTVSINCKFKNLS